MKGDKCKYIGCDNVVTEKYSRQCTKCQIKYNGWSNKPPSVDRVNKNPPYIPQYKFKNIEKGNLPEELVLEIIPQFIPKQQSVSLPLIKYKGKVVEEKFNYEERYEGFRDLHSREGIDTVGPVKFPYSGKVSD